MNGGFTLGLDSFSGRWLFRLRLYRNIEKFVEKDKYCQKVLRKNFPNIPIEEDIKNVKGKEGDADVIVGGFLANQCQSQEKEKEQMTTAISGQV